MNGEGKIIPTEDAIKKQTAIFKKKKGCSADAFVKLVVYVGDQITRVGSKRFMANRTSLKKLADVSTGW